MSVFDEAMTLRAAQPARSAATGRREGVELVGALEAGWTIADAVNGGVVMALAARALRDVLEAGGGAEAAHLEPLAVSAYFLSPTRPGDVSVRPSIARVGRAMSTGQVSVYQGDSDGEQVERLRALATFGDLAGSVDAVRTPSMPAAPAPDDCVDAQLAPERLRPPILERLDLRLDPSCVGWTVGKPSRQGVMRGWMRFADGRDMDAISLLMSLDAMPPVAFDLGLAGWVPTLELTAHVRARPAPGWVFAELTSDTLAGGLMEEDARIWDSTGRLVAQSRQLAAVRM